MLTFAVAIILHALQATVLKTFLQLEKSIQSNPTRLQFIYYAANHRLLTNISPKPPRSRL